MTQRSPIKKSDAGPVDFTAVRERSTVVNLVTDLVQGMRFWTSAIEIRERAGFCSSRSEGRKSRASRKSLSPDTC